jgi:hypothetical protein
MLQFYHRMQVNSATLKCQSLAMGPGRKSFASLLIISFDSEFRLFRLHKVNIPWAIDRNEKQVSLGPNPPLVNHFARHVIVATRT